MNDTSSPRRSTPCPIPCAHAARFNLRGLVRDYVLRQSAFVPPLALEELRDHAAALASDQGMDSSLTDYLMVLLNNELWRDTVAGIPYDRRLLLLPQCLRDPHDCPAEMDEFGLLCEECGRCSIGDLQARAEALGYVVLVAEGTTLVTKLLEGGKVDAVVGVSCLGALEKSFPHMAAEAIPGLAIPLHRDGCTATETDDDWVMDALELKSPGGWRAKVDAARLLQEVQRWFEVSALDEALGPPAGHAERLARDWLTRGGKLWRPTLLASAYQALSGDTLPLPDRVVKLAVAIECFHKASLVHDDIEDDDDERYGTATLHRTEGVPVALNVGDLLIGEGYRIIAASGNPVEMLGQLSAIAARGHRMLCLGQGEELAGLLRSEPLSSRQVLEIFRNKTAPAFGVALQLGAVAADRPEDTVKTLARFSEALGVAYQVRDDLQEYLNPEEGGYDQRRLRPSLLLALAFEQADGSLREQLLTAWRAKTLTEADLDDVRHWFEELMVVEKAQQLLEHHKNEALRTLNALTEAPLKGLLRRVVSRMLGGV